MAQKSVQQVMAPPRPHMVGDGFRVHNFIPGSTGPGMQRMDPFLMLDYNARFYFPPTDTPRGVDVHPHRGFETVTIAYRGRVAHHDSYGNSGVIGEGDVQWMTAASGVLHKEYHEKSFSQAGGDFQMVQLWVNLPAKFKMSPPKYQSITNPEIPKVEVPGGRIEVIAGEYQGIPGRASTFSPVHLQNAFLEKGASADFAFPAHFNTALVVVEGSIRVNGAEKAGTDHFVLFKNDGDTFSIEALDDAVVLILSGEPLHEPISAYGPFVMNTREEIVQAFEDAQAGKFGVLS
jgi:redox-sensitive bicupin YhaK (pirin superfamily)